MLTGLRVQNFKSWKDSGDIRLAPVTVFFGANSSGKTSLIQFLLMLRQTVESTDLRRVLDLGDANSLVDLGTFSDLIYNHDDRSDLTFEINWSLEDPPIGLSGDVTPVSNLRFGARVGQDSSGSILLRGFHYHVNDRVYRFERAPDGRNSVQYPGHEHTVSAEAGKFYLYRGGHVFGSGDAPLFFEGPPELEYQLSKLTHVGPVREEPKRTYLWAGARPADVGRFGERAIEALLAAKASGNWLWATNGEILQEQGLYELNGATPVTKIV